MKKIAIILAAMICLSANANGTMLYKMDSYFNNTAITAGREITVYQIKQVGGRAWSKTAVSATYDSEANTIKVGKFTYSVTKNLAYGQSDDARGEFKYVAGGYYFNL